MFSHNLVCDHFPLALLKQIPLSLIPCMKLLFQTTQSFPLTPAVWYHSHWGCPWRGVPLNLDLGFEYGSLPDLPFGFQKTIGFLFKDSVALTLHAMIHIQAKMLKNQRNYNCPPPVFYPQGSNYDRSAFLVSFSVSHIHFIILSKRWLLCITSFTVLRKMNSQNRSTGIWWQTLCQDSKPVSLPSLEVSGTCDCDMGCLRVHGKLSSSHVFFLVFTS